jgi:hypothetical protein
MLPVFAAGPEYTSDGRLKFPENYREWVFLSTGIGMSYGPLAAQAQPNAPIFDNIFVNPEAYRAFLKTGRWPDKTMLVMEARFSESHGSINNRGHFQTDMVGVEANVKDSSAPEGPWNFYGFNVRSGQPVEPAKAVSHQSGCFGCHGVQTAVENTFVQFYPPLYDVAERLHTLNPTFKPLPLTPGKLFDRIRQNGWKNTVSALDDTAKNSPDATVMSEQILNQIAYRLISSDVVGDAMNLLQWATASYPQSANIQDSLGEAAEKYGATWIARPASERALKLLPDDKTLAPARRERLLAGAEERLKRLPDMSGKNMPRIEVHAGAPDVSPDGSRISFHSIRDGEPKVYAINVDGTGETLIGADTRRRGERTLVSPDGKHTLIGDGRIYLANADGSDARPITNGVAMEQPAWSPDSKRIAIARRGFGIWIMNADGTEPRQSAAIPAGEGTAEWLRWSPDGSRIAIQVGSYSPGHRIAHVWVIDAAGGQTRKLAAHTALYLDETPAWFPDSKRLAFQSDRSGRMEVWVMNADGTGARQITK